MLSVPSDETEEGELTNVDVVIGATVVMVEHEFEEHTVMHTVLPGTVVSGYMVHISFGEQTVS
jgi:hypothetical protein